MINPNDPIKNVIISLSDLHLHSAWCEKENERIQIFVKHLSRIAKVGWTKKSLYLSVKVFSTVVLMWGSLNYSYNIYQTKNSSGLWISRSHLKDLVGLFLSGQLVHVKALQKIGKNLAVCSELPNIDGCLL